MTLAIYEIFDSRTAKLILASIMSSFIILRKINY